MKEGNHQLTAEVHGDLKKKKTKVLTETSRGEQVKQVVH